MIHLVSSSDAFFITCNSSVITVYFPTGHSQTIECWFRVSSLSLSPNDEILCIVGDYLIGHVFDLKRWRWMKVKAYVASYGRLNLPSMHALVDWSSTHIFWIATRQSNGSLIVMTTLDGHQLSHHSFPQRIEMACLYHDEQHLLFLMESQWRQYHLKFRYMSFMNRAICQTGRVLACVEHCDQLYGVYSERGESTLVRFDTQPTELFSHDQHPDLNLVISSDGFHLKTPFIIASVLTPDQIKKNLLQCYEDVFGSRELYAVLHIIIHYLHIPFEFCDRTMIPSLDENEIRTVMIKAYCSMSVAVKALERHGNVLDAILELTS
jgi:hypothetical protein